LKNDSAQSISLPGINIGEYAVDAELSYLFT